MKYCCTCKIQKPFEEFFKSKKATDGIERQCKICKKNSNKPEANRIRCKNYRERNPEKSVDSSKAWRNKNQKYSLEYYYNNKKAWIDRNARYIKNKYNTDANYRVQKILSSQIWSFLNGKTKSNRTMELLGYTAQDFVQMIGLGSDSEQIDHKIPVTWFKKDTPLNIIWDLANLQWIDIKENQSKGNRFAHPVSKEYLQLAILHIKDEYLTFIK
jgi:hypothetical protein